MIQLYWICNTESVLSKFDIHSFVSIPCNSILLKTQGRQKNCSKHLLILTLIFRHNLPSHFFQVQKIFLHTPPPPKHFFTYIYFGITAPPPPTFYQAQPPPTTVFMSIKYFYIPPPNIFSKCKNNFAYLPQYFIRPNPPPIFFKSIQLYLGITPPPL